MNKNEFPNIDIDEMLNSFVDGELDARHRTEIQRLIEHDTQVAKRLQKIRNCKMLVSSLPYAEAPQGTLENIQAAIEKRQLPAQQTRYRQFDRHKGAKHLMFRRLIAAAAMIALVAVLAAVIYSIIAPESVIDEPLATEQWLYPELQKPAPDVMEAFAERHSDKTVFSGKLVLKTNEPYKVVAFISTAIERTIPLEEQIPATTEMELSCSRQNFNSFMTEMGKIWNKFDSATLIVNTNLPEQQVAVAAVVPEQILEIANQDELETRIKAAQYFASLNNMTTITPGKNTMLASGETDTDLTTIPKPVLTSGANRPSAETTKQTEPEHKVVLDIVVKDND